MKTDGWQCHKCGTPLVPWEQPLCFRCEQKEPPKANSHASLAAEVERLRAALAESKREHLSEHVPCAVYDEGSLSCTCGADEFNARIDAALGEKQ